MKPAHLLARELNYELRIRGIITERKDAQQKRKILAKLLEKDRARMDIVLRDPQYDFDDEKVVIDETIDSIKTVIGEFEGPESDSTCKRVRSRIIHLTERVKRIEVVDNERKEEIQTFKNESLATCLELEVLLEEKIVKDAALVDLTSFSNSSAVQPIVQNIVQPNFRSVPVYKWNLQFSGDKHSDLIAFLERIEELRISRHVEKQELFESAVDLFSGNALLWFRSIRSSVQDWDSLVALLKYEFLPADYVDHVWEKLRNRVQLPSEPIHIYIAAMENLFSQLGHYVAECTKVKYIKKNLLPHYIQQLALVTINSLADLSMYCKKIDEAVVIKNNRPCTNRIASIEDTVTDSKPHSTFRNDEPRIKNEFRNSRSHKQNRSDLKPIVCWNCNQINHTYQDCRARRNTFCYRCGNPGATIKTCSCSKN